MSGIGLHLYIKQVIIEAPALTVVCLVLMQQNTPFFLVLSFHFLLGVKFLETSLNKNQINI
jgi:hypothetical protein